MTVCYESIKRVWLSVMSQLGGMTICYESIKRV